MKSLLTENVRRLMWFVGIGVMVGLITTVVNMGSRLANETIAIRNLGEMVAGVLGGGFWGLVAVLLYNRAEKNREGK